MYPTTERRKWVYPSQVTALSTCGDSSDTGETEHFTFDAVKLRGCSEGTATISLKSWDGVRTYGTVDVEVLANLPKAAPPDLEGGAGYTLASLRWPAVDGASKYEVRHKEEGGEWSAKETEHSYIDISVTRNKNYVFQARSYGDGLERSAVWGDWSENYPIRTHPPGAAHRLSGAVESATSIKATWTIPEGTGVYEIEYKERDAETWTKVGPQSAKIGEVSHTIESLAPRLWSVRVRLLGDGIYSAAVYSKYVYAHDINLLTPFVELGSFATSCGVSEHARKSQGLSQTSASGGTHAGTVSVVSRLFVPSGEHVLLKPRQFCVEVQSVTRSTPGADKIEWEAGLYKRKKTLPSSFQVSQLDDMTLSEFYALFQVSSEPSRTDTAAESIPTDSCPWCQGEAHRSTTARFDERFFSREVAYALGTHKFKEAGWASSIETKAQWDAPLLRIDSRRTQRGEMVKELEAAGLSNADARRVADWVLDKRGL